MAATPYKGAPSKVNSAKHVKPSRTGGPAHARAKEPTLFSSAPTSADEANYADMVNPLVEANSPYTNTNPYASANSSHADSSNPYARANYGTKASGDQAKRPRRMTTPKRIAIIVVSVIVALLLAVGIYALWFMGALDRALAPDGDDVAAINDQLVSSSLDEPFYLLVLGSDSREGSGVEADNASYADGQERSDVILLIRIDATERQLTMVSVPRDTPYFKDDGSVIKINEAYNEGGAAESIEAVSKLTGVGIAHYASVHISDMEAIVDALGGIDVYVDRELTVLDALTGETVTLQPGQQTLNGQQAQVFLRTRHSYADTGNQDGHRQANVRTFVQAVIDRVLEQPVTELPGTILNLAQHVSSDLNSSDLIGLATKFSGGKTTIYSCSGPTDGANMEQYNNQWMCYPNPEGWAELMRQVDAGLKPGDIDYDATSIKE